MNLKEDSYLLSTYYVPGTGDTVLSWVGKTVEEETQGSQVFGLHSWANGDLHRGRALEGKRGLGGR